MLGSGLLGIGDSGIESGIVGGASGIVRFSERFCVGEIMVLLSGIV
jgi:hypothetical protein